MLAAKASWAGWPIFFDHAFYFTCPRTLLSWQTFLTIRVASINPIWLLYLDRFISCLIMTALSVKAHAQQWNWVLTARLIAEVNVDLLIATTLWSGADVSPSTKGQLSHEWPYTVGWFISTIRLLDWLIGMTMRELCIPLVSYSDRILFCSSHWPSNKHRSCYCRSLYKFIPFECNHCSYNCSSWRWKTIVRINLSCSERYNWLISTCSCRGRLDVLPDKE